MDKTKVIALVVAGVSILGLACANAKRTDQGIIFVPDPVGDLTEVGVERELRSATGLYMGMKRGLALEELLEGGDVEYSSTPTSGGITSLRFGERSYFSLYSYHLPHDTSTILVCGYSVWTTGDRLPDVIPVDAIARELRGDPRTITSDLAQYRKTKLRVIALDQSEGAKAFFYIDITKCPARDPGPPEDDDL